MAKAQTKPTTITPSELAKELEVDAKALRAYLRKNHARPKDAFRSRWDIDAETAEAVREHYANRGADSEDESDES